VYGYINLPSTLIMACAKAAGVDFIVTGNKRHFPQRACEAIRVVNGVELLDRITLEI
jgi:hypothetical protein